MKPSKSFIGLIVVSTIFFIYASGVYKNLQSDSALEVVDFSIDGAKIIKQVGRYYELKTHQNLRDKLELHARHLILHLDLFEILP